MALSVKTGNFGGGSTGGGLEGYTKILSVDSLQSYSGDTRYWSFTYLNSKITWYAIRPYILEIMPKSLPTKSQGLMRILVPIVGSPNPITNFPYITYGYVTGGIIAYTRHQNKNAEDTISISTSGLNTTITVQLADGLFEQGKEYTLNVYEFNNY